MVTSGCFRCQLRLILYLHRPMNIQTLGTLLAWFQWHYSGTNDHVIFTALYIYYYLPPTVPINFNRQRNIYTQISVCVIQPPYFFLSLVTNLSVGEKTMYGTSAFLYRSNGTPRPLSVTIMGSLRTANRRYNFFTRCRMHGADPYNYITAICIEYIYIYMYDT